MKSSPILLLALSCITTALSSCDPTAIDTKNNVTYQGVSRNGIELFLNIPYGQDTSGENRFKPPRPAVPAPGSTITATEYGPACPQQLGPFLRPLTLTDVTAVSEDCLNLNVARPQGAQIGDRLPVLVWIHGGSFWTGQNGELTTAPDGMILESVKNGLPVMHVAMNYRLGFFGFAQSDAITSEGSANAGLKDQRLALEWVRDNIEKFGGDPDRVTIFGQSSGGLAMGMQILAYGGSKPVPFQQAICESQALEPGITGNFTIDAMQLMVDYVGCNTTGLHSPQTVDCLRDFDTNTLLNASLTTYIGDIAHNIGDIWLPVADGDFLPAAPSTLVMEKRFANVTTMIGWTENDVTFFSDFTIKTPEDTRTFISSYIPDVTSENIDKLLALYPVEEFPPVANLSSEFFRSARIFRDIIMVCQPIWLGENLAAAGNDVFLYDWNATILDPILAVVYSQPGLGPVHTSEFAYIFGNLSHYNTSGYPFDPTPEDYALVARGSRSWSTFAATGKPELEGHDTFKGFVEAFQGGETFVFVAGGPSEGLSPIDGEAAKPVIAAEKLKERCAFLNSPEMIQQLKY